MMWKMLNLSTEKTSLILHRGFRKAFIWKIISDQVKFKEFEFKSGLRVHRVQKDIPGRLSHCK